MEYRVNEDEKWARKSFGMCKHAFLLKAYEKFLKETITIVPEMFDRMEAQAEDLASRSMRIKDESLFKPPATQPFRNDVIRAKVENKTNNVPFN